MRITGIEISVEYNCSGHYEHENYCDSIEDAIRYLKKLKKKAEEENED